MSLYYDPNNNQMGSASSKAQMRGPNVIDPTRILKDQHLPVIWVPGHAHVPAMHTRHQFCKGLAQELGFVHLDMDCQIRHWTNQLFKKASTEEILILPAPVKRLATMCAQLMNDEELHLNISGTLEMLRLAMLNTLEESKLRGHPVNGFIIEDFPCSMREAEAFENSLYPASVVLYFENRWWSQDDQKCVDPQVQIPIYFRRDSFYSERQVEEVADRWNAKSFKILNMEDFADYEAIYLADVIKQKLWRAGLSRYQEQALSQHTSVLSHNYNSQGQQYNSFGGGQGQGNRNDASFADNGMNQPPSMYKCMDPNCKFSCGGGVVNPNQQQMMRPMQNVGSGFGGTSSRNMRSEMDYEAGTASIDGPMIITCPMKRPKKKKLKNGERLEKEKSRPLTFNKAKPESRQKKKERERAEAIVEPEERKSRSSERTGSRGSPSSRRTIKTTSDAPNSATSKTTGSTSGEKQGKSRSPRRRSGSRSSSESSGHSINDTMSESEHRHSAKRPSSGESNRRSSLKGKSSRSSSPVYDGASSVVDNSATPVFDGASPETKRGKTKMNKSQSKTSPKNINSTPSDICNSNNDKSREQTTTKIVGKSEKIQPAKEPPKIAIKDDQDQNNVASVRAQKPSESPSTHQNEAPPKEQTLLSMQDPPSTSKTKTKLAKKISDDMESKSRQLTSSATNDKAKSKSPSSPSAGQLLTLEPEQPPTPVPSMDRLNSSTRISPKKPKTPNNNLKAKSKSSSSPFAAQLPTLEPEQPPTPVPSLDRLNSSTRISLKKPKTPNNNLKTKSKSPSAAQLRPSESEQPPAPSMYRLKSSTSISPKKPKTPNNNLKAKSKGPTAAPLQPSEPEKPPAPSMHRLKSSISISFKRCKTPNNTLKAKSKSTLLRPKTGLLTPLPSSHQPSCSRHTLKSTKSKSRTQLKTAPSKANVCSRQPSKSPLRRRDSGILERSYQERRGNSAIHQVSTSRYSLQRSKSKPSVRNMREPSNPQKNNRGSSMPPNNNGAQRQRNQNSNSSGEILLNALRKSKDKLPKLFHLDYMNNAQGASGITRVKSHINVKRKNSQYRNQSNERNQPRNQESRDRSRSQSKRQTKDPFYVPRT